MIDIREKKKLLIEMYWECDYIGFIYLFYKLLSTRLDIVNILKKILFRRVKDGGHLLAASIRQRCGVRSQE